MERSFHKIRQINQVYWTRVASEEEKLSALTDFHPASRPDRIAYPKYGDGYRIHPASLTIIPQKNISLTADDFITIFSWVVTQSSRHLQGLFALTHFLKDYLEIFHLVIVRKGRPSARVFYDECYYGLEAISCTTIQ